MRNLEVELPQPPASPGLNEWAWECVRLLDRQISQLTSERDVYARFLESSPRGVAAQAAAPSADIDLTQVVVDLHGSRDTLGRAIRVAEAAPDKLLNVTQLAKLLIRAGYTKSEVNNARATVQRALSNRPDLFRRVRPGTYKYIDGPGSYGHPSYSEEDEDDWEPSPSDLASTVHIRPSPHFGGGGGPN